MHTYFIIKSFTGALGNYAAGTTAEFEDGPAAILTDKGIAALEGSAAHKAYLVSPAPAVEGESAAVETKPEPAPELETKPAPTVNIHTKPAPRTAKKASK